MRVRALKTTTGLPRGSVADIDTYTARELIAQGYAIEELPLDKQEAANDNVPFETAQTGGLTGADVPQSSLPVGQAQAGLTSPQDAGEQKLDSSPSTTDTDSAHGQTSSTPATTTGGKRKRGRLRLKG